MSKPYYAEGHGLVIGLEPYRAHARSEPLTLITLFLELLGLFLHTWSPFRSRPCGLEIFLPYDPYIPLYGIYPKVIQQLQGGRIINKVPSMTVCIASLLQIPYTLETFI